MAVNRETRRAAVLEAAAERTAAPERIIDIQTPVTTDVRRVRYGLPTSKEQLVVMKSIGDRVAEEQKKMMFSLPKLTPEIKREVLKARAANITREESERAYGLDASTGELTLRGERAYHEALKERERQIDLTPFTEWKARTSGAGSSTDDSAFGNGALRTGSFSLRPQDDSVYDWGLKAEAERKRGEALLAKMKEEDELTAGNLRRLDERMQEKANARAEYEAGLAKAKEEASVHKRESRRQAYAAAGAAVSGDMKASREAGEAYEREAALSDANVTYREEIAKKKAAEKLEYLSSVKYDKEFDRYAARGARMESPAAELAGRAVEGGDTHRTISEMNADEWKIYNYYIGRGMTERAKEYLAALEPTLESRAARTLEAEEHTFAQEHPVLGSLKLMLNTLFEPAGMLEVAATNIDNAVSDLSGRPQDYKAVNADSTLMRPVIQSQGLRSGVTADMSPLAAQATDIGLSMGQTAVRLPLGKLGLTTAAMGAASNSARDAVQRGASASQALGIGLTSGFAEYLAEKIPFESLMGMLRAGRKPAQGVIANMLKQAGIEGAEELATEYANVLSDIAIMGEKSEYRTMVRELMENGMSAEEAEAAARREFFVDRPAAAFVGGAISGGLFAGGAGAINAIADSGNDLTKAYGKDMETARRIARSAGTQLRVAELENGVQGEYRDGVITISPTAKDPVRQVLVHELTHHLETSGLYDAFSQRVLSFMAEDSGSSIEQLRASIAQDYAQAGKTLDTDGAARELVAAFCESKLFTDEKSVRRLLHSDGNLFMRVYYWVRDMAKKLRGTAEEKFLIDTQRMYEKALRSTGERRGYGDAQYMFARAQDAQAMARAEQMEAEGKSRDEIWRETGVIRDASGNWVYEIDDSGAKFDRDGMLGIKEQPWYGRIAELEKLIFDPENLGRMSEEQASALESEYNALVAAHEEEVYREGVLLKDFLGHDALFEQYPDLKYRTLRFDDLQDGVKGYYSSRDGAIVLSKNLFGKDKQTLMHEIQHVIQRADGRAGGASIEYWQRRLDNGETFTKNMRAVEQADERYRALFDSAPEALKNKIREMNRARLSGDTDAAARIADELYESAYADLYSDIETADFDRRMLRDYDEPLHASDLYRNTSGEIEARQTQERMNLTAEERRQKTPDFGWERAVFADGTVSFSEDVPFKDQVAEVLRPKADAKGKNVETHLNMGKTPDLYSRFGLNTELPLLITAKHVRDMHMPETTSGNENYHGLTEGKIRNLPKEIADPVMVMVSRTRPNDSIVVVTSLVDQKKRPIIAAILLDGNGNYNSVAIDANVVTSSYGRTGMQDFVTRAFSEGRMLYLNEKRSRTLQNTPGVQFPNNIPKGDFKDNIARFLANVNSRRAAKGQSSIGLSYDELVRHVRERYPEGAGSPTDGILRSIAPQNDSVMGQEAQQQNRAEFEPNMPKQKEDGTQETDIPQTELKSIDEKTALPSTEIFASNPIAEKGNAADIGSQQNKNSKKSDIPESAVWTKKTFSCALKLARGEVPTSAEARDYIRYMQEQEYELTDEETALLRQSGLANVDKILDNLAARGKRPYTMEEARRANAFPFPEELEAKEGRNPLVAPPAADGKTLSLQDIKIDSPMYASDGSEGKLAAELQKGDVRKQIEKRIRNMQAGAKEKAFAKGIAEGTFSLEDTPRTLDKHVVEELAGLYRQRAELKDTGAERAKSQAQPVFDQTMYELVAETEGIKGGSVLRMWANTADRNNLRIFGEKLGAKINALLFDPIAANEAERIRFMNREIDRVRALNLTDEESYWVQAVGDTTIDQTINDVPAEMRPKVQKAVELFSSIYEQYHVLANNFLVSRGYAPIGYQKGYFPHFTEEEGGIVQALKTLGMDERVTPLDTSAQGQTEFRKPGKKWNPYFLERNGVKTEVDAVKGFERYVSALSDVLYHTDDIQKLRRFEKAIRDRYSSDELSQEIEFQHDKYLNGEQSFDDFMEKRDEALKTLGNVRNLGGYAEWLLNYTNKLAGKQVTPDRAMEALFGRSTLNVGREMQDAFAKSAVFGNISTALNNIIPVVQATGEVKTGSMVRAAQEYISGQLDDFIMESDFLSSRAGVDWLTMKPGKAARAMSWPFEKMDELSTVWVTRAKYLDEINAGADHRTALKRADDFARKIVGDRSKGQKALVFEAKNPLMRLLTTFQLEVANNMAHWTQDLPREFRRIRDEKGAKEMAKQLALWFVKGQVATFLANMFIKALTGREPVPGDVGGTVKNLVTDLSNPDMTAGDALGNLGETLVSQVPYLSGAAAMAGIGNGRLPIPQVDDDLLKGLGKFVDDKAGNWQFGLGQAALGAGKTALGFVPGGNQIKKTAKGIKAAVRGGEYSMTEEGERLKFPVGQDPFSIGRLVLFGAYADDNARKYVDSGFQSLSAKDTQTIKDAVAAGIDRQKAFDAIKSTKGLKANKDADGNTVKSVAEKQREAIDQNPELTEEERVFFRMALLDESQREKAAKLEKKGIDNETFIDIYDEYTRLNKRADKDNGTKRSERLKRAATDFSKYLDGLYLSDAKREAVDNAFKMWTQIPVESEGYRLELMSEAAQERYPDAEAAGYTEQEYVKYYPVFTQQKKKDEILAEAVGMGMSKKEAEEFWKIVKAKKEDEFQSTLGKPVLEEKKFVELPIFGPDGFQSTLP